MEPRLKIAMRKSHCEWVYHGKQADSNGDRDMNHFQYCQKFRGEIFLPGSIFAVVSGSSEVTMNPLTEPDLMSPLIRLFRSIFSTFE